MGNLSSHRSAIKGTAANPARVLIVDDSRTIRGLIRSALEKDPRLVVVAEAERASEARDKINDFRPDIMTLDVEMPNMSGIEFLARVMKHRPMPVVMVSTLTKAGSAIAVEAMAKGAVDCVEKPRTGDISRSFGALPDILVAAANARLDGLVHSKSKANVSVSGRPFQRICLLGGSTGAVDAIESILRVFPPDCPPTLITQHMPAPFLNSFAQRLDPLVAPKVKLAEDGETLMGGQVLIAPGGVYHLNIEQGLRPKVRLHEGPKVSGHIPSVDSMFESALPLANQVVAGLLTGMGRDGAEGLARLRAQGAITYGQSEDSCVVFGMPRVAGELDGVDEWVHLDVFAQHVLKAAETPAGADRS